MSRSTITKILGEQRPLDKFNFLRELPKEFTYCEKTKRLRKVTTGAFASSKEVAIVKKHQEKRESRIGSPPILKEKKELRFSKGGEQQLKLDNFKRRDWKARKKRGHDVVKPQTRHYSRTAPKDYNWYAD